MKILDVIQGSQQWLDLRVGVLTASRFDKVITPKTMKPSASATGLCYEMLAEEVLGRSLSDASSTFMQRGTEMEHEARAWYEFETNTDVAEVGLVLRDDLRVGCSPDGLVGDEGGLEIKCPSAATHVGYLLGGVDAEYRCQVQGSLWLTERRWWDFLSYCPGFPPVLLRFTPDAVFHAALADAVDGKSGFLATYDAHREKLKNMGLITRAPLAQRTVAAETLREMIAGAA